MRLPLFLRPTSIDEARYFIQCRLFIKLLSGIYFQGFALNAGCGQGIFKRFLERFSELKKIVHADLFLPAVYNPLTQGKNFLIGASLTSIPFQDNTFDFCLCSEVLEHIHDDRAALKEFSRVMKEGSILLLSVPTPPAPADPHHVREGYTLTAASEILEENGFKIRRSQFGLHGIMRVLYSLSAQPVTFLGKIRIFVLPRFLMLALAWLDLSLKLGKPWDLLVVAERSR